MRIETITIEGLWSYADPQTIELAGIPLLVGTGPNGAGKSAILVSSVLAAFYARFPTKTIEESIHTGSNGGSVSIVFTVAGARHRVTRWWPRNGKATATVSVEDQAEPNGWRAVAEGPREVTSHLTTLLGMSYETAAMTWVAEQGAYGKFAAAQPTDRFKLLAGVFDLGKYQKLHKSATSAHAAAAQQVAKLDGRIMEISDGLVVDDATPATGLAALDDAELAARIDQAQQDVDTAAARITAHEQADPARDAERARSQFERVHTIRQQALEQAQRAATNANSIGRAARERASTARADADARLQRTLSEADRRAEAEATRAAAIQQRAAAALADIEATRETLPGLHAESASLAETAAGHRATAAAHLARAQELTGVTERLRTEFGTLRTAFAENLERVAILERTAADTEHASCFTCGQHLSPADAAALIKMLHEQNAAHAARQQQINIEGAQAARDIDAANTAAASANAAASTVDQQAQQLTASIARAETLINSQREHASAAEHAAADALTARAAADTEKEQAEATHRAELARISETEEAEVAAARQQLDDANAIIIVSSTPTAEEQELAAELATAEQAAASGAAERSATLAGLTTDRDAARARLTELIGVRTEREGAATRRAEQEQRMAAAAADLAAAKSEHSITGNLVRAYAPSGIPAMILAGVMEQLNDAVNAALTHLSRGQLTVQLRTTRDTADGRTENKVTVYVLTPDGIRPYESLSGGQKFRVDLAIRTGLTQVIARGTGTPIETFILDEGWGSLDEVGIHSTFDALHRLSDTTNVITVSHIDSVRDAFAARVEVSLNEGASVATVRRSDLFAPAAAS